MVRRRWTDKDLEAELVTQAQQLGRMPKRTEMGPGVYMAVCKSGGIRCWAKRLGMGVSREPWTDTRIERAIMSMVDERRFMPTASQMKVEYPGLYSALARGQGMSRKWAKRLGLRTQNSNSERAYRMEVDVCDAILALGMPAELTRTKCAYDVLVDGRLKVEVKLAKYTKTARGYIFHFGVDGATRAFDLAVLVCVDAADNPIKTYLIPKEHCAQQTVTITGSNRWKPFLERWRTVQELLHIMDLGGENGDESRDKQT